MNNSFIFKFSDEECLALEALSQKLELSPNGILKQALRTYQLIDSGLATLTIKDENIDGCE